MNTTTPKIGLSTAVIIGMNAMIGAGIFSVPAALASHVGPAGIITYAFVIIAVWCMGFAMARLAHLYPYEGSFYLYAGQWGGRTLGLLAAGAYLIGMVIAMGLLLQIASSYLAFALPSLSPTLMGTTILGLLTIITMCGVPLSQPGQIALIIGTVAPLLATIAMCLAHADFNNLFPFMPYGLTNIFAATKAVIFGFFGFECATSLFGLVESPEKNVPKALTYAIGFVGALYLTFVVSLLLAIPHDILAQPGVPLTAILKQTFPDNNILIHLIGISVLSSLIGTIHSMMWAAGSLLVSYLTYLFFPAHENLSFKEQNHFHAQASHNPPLSQAHCVLAISLAILCNFLLIKNQDLFFSLTAIFVIFAYVSSMLTLLTLPYEWKSGHNVITLLGIATALVIFGFALAGLAEAYQPFL